MGNSDKSALGQAKPDLNRSAVARYIQLSTLFRQRIEVATWKEGQQIPTVGELASECGVARETVRQALGILENEGLIERFRAKGTFVKKRPDNPFWCEVHTDFFGLLKAREDAEIELLGEESNVSLPEAATMGHPAQSYRFLRRRHLRNGQVYMLADIWVDEALMPHISRAALTSRTALRLVADVSPVNVADVEQILTIGSADLEIACALDIALSSPIARVRRSAISDTGTLVLFTRGVYRGDVVTLNIKMQGNYLDRRPEDQ
jgi:GntR family transcriptional regulator